MIRRPNGTQCARMLAATTVAAILTSLGAIPASAMAPNVLAAKPRPAATAASLGFRQGPDPGVDSGTGADPGTGAAPSSGSDPGVSSGPSSGPDPITGLGAGAGASSGPRLGSGAGSRPSPGLGSGLGSGAGLNSRHGAGAGSSAMEGSVGSSSSPTAAELRTTNKAARDTAIQASQQAHARAIAEHQAALAAGRAAHTQAAAERRAANAAHRAGHLAAAAVSARANWARTGQPDRLIIVRAHDIDAVTNGHLTGRTPRPAGVLTLTTLARYVPAGWLTLLGNGSAQLAASLALTATTSLDNGPEIHTLGLVGSAGPGPPASIWIGGGHLTLHNVTLISTVPPNQQVAPPSAPERGFLTVGSGGTLDIIDAKLFGLGYARPATARSGVGPTSSSKAPSPGLTGGQGAGVVFGPGSTGSIVRSTLDGNGVGLKLAGSHDVQLDTVTLVHSQSVGLALHGDRGTKMRAVRSEDNGGDGVLVTGPSTDRAVSSVRTASNGGFGVAVIRQDNPHITGVTSTADQAGGVRLTATTGASVTNLTSTDAPIGLLIDGISNHLRLTDVHTRGGQRGIVFTQAVTDVELSVSVIEDAAVAGVALAATDTRLSGTTIQNSSTGIQVSSRAARTTITDTSIAGGRDGVLVARGATAVMVGNLTADGASHNAVTTAATGTHIAGGRIIGGATGINARAATDISGLVISEAHEAIHVLPATRVTGERIDVLAASSGIKVDPSGEFVLTDSRVRAREALRGQVTLLGTNTISPPPFNWLGAFGVFFIALAVLLELVQLTRQRRQTRPVTGAATGSLAMPTPTLSFHEASSLVAVEARLRR